MCLLFLFLLYINIEWLNKYYYYFLFVRDTLLMIGIAYQTGDFGRKLKSHSSAFATCDASQLT